ncbi:MAG: hypothetical protein Kow001_00450 [Acidobacteriota bacterium]
MLRKLGTFVAVLMLGPGVGFGQCWSAYETVVSGDDKDLASSRRGQLGTVDCTVGENVGPIVKTIWNPAPGPGGCGGSPVERDGLVQQWYNWYPDVVTLTGSSYTASVFCESVGNATVGVKVEEPHNWCSATSCNPLSSGFPVVAIAVEVTE